MGLVLEVTNSYHQGRHGVEIRVISLSKDGSPLWIRISDGLNKLVRDLTERVRICENEQNTSNGTGLPLLNRDRNRHQLHCHFQQLRLSRFISENGSMSNWGNTTQKSDEVAKKIGSLLRHGSPLREDDGAIESRRLESMFASRFTSSPHWSVRLWIRHLERGGGPTKRFQYLIDPYSVDTILYLRAIQSLSGRNPDDPSLQDNVMIPNASSSTSATLAATQRTPIINSGLTGTTDGILCSRGPLEGKSSRATRVRFDQAQSCCLQAKLEGTSEFSVLDQSEACSKKGTDVLPDEVKRDHSLRHTPIILH